MFKILKKRIRNEKGLSLVELLAVIVILGIISAIAVPAIGNIIENSRVKAELADAIQIMNAANIYFVDNPDADKFEKTANANDYLESANKITAFTVKKGAITSGVKANNTITFVGTKIGRETDKTLADLTNATVVKGKVVWK